MGPVSALVLLAVVWWMTFFIVLPLRMRSQGDEGEIVPGTHASAPANFQMKRKLKITTLWAVPIWAVLAAIILSGVVTIDGMDFMSDSRDSFTNLPATDDTGE